MSAISTDAIRNIVRRFFPLLGSQCWALSNGKKPWNYKEGYGLTWSDQDLLLTFWDAEEMLHDRLTHGAGIGLFLGVDNNRIACLDLDGALVNDQPCNDTVRRIVRNACTFTEVSVSGAGLHLFFEVEKDTAPFHLKEGITAKGGDFFTQKRFIRLTGDIYGKDYPIRHLSPRNVEFIRDTYGKAAALAVPEVRSFFGQANGRSLSERLTTAGIPFRSATIPAQAFHNEHGGIVECIETECPNIRAHTSDASPNAKFFRFADGLIAGRCFHSHCDPAVLRAAGKSLANLLSAKLRKAGSPDIVYVLLEKCKAMGMSPIPEDQVRELGEPAIVARCEKFLRGVTC